MKYVRTWKCAQCGDAVIIDTVKKTQSCGCGSFELLPEFLVTDDFLTKYELLCL